MSINTLATPLRTSWHRRRGLALLLGMWLIGLGALASILVLHERANRRETGQLVLEQMRRQVGEIPGLVFGTIPARGVPRSRAKQRLLEAEARFDALEATLDGYRLRAHSAELARLTDRFHAIANRALALTLVGKQEAAARLLAQANRPLGAESRLRRELGIANIEFSREAQQARLFAYLGSTLAIVLMLAAFSTAIYRLIRSRRRAEALAGENGVLLGRSRREEKRYRDLFDNANEPIATVDLESKVTGANRALAEALGYTPEELVGTSLNDYLTPEGRERSATERERKLSGDERRATYEQEFVGRGGRRVIFEVSTRLIEENGKPVGVQGMCRDITKRKQAEAELNRQVEVNRQQALHDPLTGLPNRTQFQERIEQQIAACAATDAEFTVLLIDLDRFKEINDSLGHQCGDFMLQQLAQSLSASTRESDTVARLGGDEFGVLLPKTAETDESWPDVVDRCRVALERTVVIQGVPVSVEASIGVAFYPAHGESTDLLLQHAAVAMYVAKKRGQSHALYDACDDRSDARRLTLIGELRRAIERRELVLHYQPIVDLRDGNSTKVEALVRWQHPEHGLLPPGQFMPLAEQTGLIKPLTRYVLQEAVRQCKEWERDGHVVSVAVNLSTRNFAEPDLVETIVATLERENLEPGRLLLEITESAMIEDPIRTEQALSPLSKLGVELAIDDFGTGFTSLSSLARLPLNQIKIDRSFVARILEDSRDLAIVRSIIDLAHDLDLEVVAEGVEDKQTLEALRRLECDVVQGFYFGRPVPPAELTNCLNGVKAKHGWKAAA